jgi:hypothetical protein
MSRRHPMMALWMIYHFKGKGMAATKLFVLRRGNQYIAWDGKTMTDRPSQAGRFSRTLCQRKYHGYEMLSFPEAYKQWYMAKEDNNKSEGGKE